MENALIRIAELYHQLLLNPLLSEKVRSLLNERLGFKHVIDLEELIKKYGLGTGNKDLNISRYFDPATLYSFQVRWEDFAIHQPSIVIPIFDATGGIQVLTSYEPDSFFPHLRTNLRQFLKKISGTIFVTETEVEMLILNVLGFQAYPRWLLSSREIELSDVDKIIVFDDYKNGFPGNRFKNYIKLCVHQDVPVKIIGLNETSTKEFLNFYKENSLEKMNELILNAKNPLHALFS